MEEDPGRPKRVARFLPRALDDLQDIDEWTRGRWSDEQADEYRRFLYDEAEFLAAEPSLGQPLKARKGLRIFLAKSSRQRWSDGHWLVYAQTHDGIDIVRVLHTKMDVNRHLRGNISG